MTREMDCLTSICDAEKNRDFGDGEIILECGGLTPLSLSRFVVA